MRSFLHHGKLRIVNRVYHPYWDWECFKAGMYEPMNKDELQRGIDLYRTFLSNNLRFYQTGSNMIRAWPNSCEQFLLSPSINRVAWIGQASLCFEYGVSRDARSGFMKLSQREQEEANGVATIILKEWRDAYEKRDRFIYKQMEMPRVPKGYSRRLPRRVTALKPCP